MESATVDSSPKVDKSPVSEPDTPSTAVTRTPTLAGQQMSASLRERLKRSGRCYSSPVSTKRIRLDVKPTSKYPENCDNSKPQEKDLPTLDGSETTNSSSPDNKVEGGKENIDTVLGADSNTDSKDSLSVTESKTVNMSTHQTSPTLTKELPQTGGKNLRLVRLNLRDAVTKKEEKLRKLKMVKMYRSKNNLSELSDLIAKWRSVSQGALQDLLALSQSEPKPSLSQLTHHLGVDPRLLHLNTDEDSFC